MEGPSSPQGLQVEHVSIVVACCLACGVPAAMILSTAGIFYPIIASDLHVSTAEISAWMSVSMLSSAFFSPIIGNLVSRYNVRNFMLLGIVLAGMTFALFSAGTAPWMFWVAGGFGGFSLVTCLGLLPSVLVNRWFCKNVGFIIGLCTSFTGIGGVVFLALGQGIIDAYGWRAAYLAFAVITVVVCLPAVALFVRDWPSDRGVRAFGEVEQDRVELLVEPTGLSEGSGREPAVSPRLGKAHAQSGGTRCSMPPKAGLPAVAGSRNGDVAGRGVPANGHLRTAAFWLLVGSGFFMNLVCQVNGYFPLYVDWLDKQAAYGVMAGSYTTGAVLLGLSQVGNAAGKIALGAAIDLSPGKALSLLAVCGGCGTACVWLAPTTPLVTVGGLLFGVFIAGGVVLLPMLVRTVFGSGEEYPVILSRVSVAPTAGSAVGNVAFPLIAESAAGFDAVFALTLASVALVLVFALAALAQRHGANIRASIP